MNGLTWFVYTGSSSAGDKLSVLSREAVPRGRSGDLKLSGCHVVAEGIVDHGVKINVIAYHQSEGVQDGGVVCVDGNICGEGEVCGSRNLAVEHGNAVASLLNAADLLCAGRAGVCADCHMEGIVTVSLQAEIHAA